jgi:hypothetical protein
LPGAPTKVHFRLRFLISGLPADRLSDSVSEHPVDGILALVLERLRSSMRPIVRHHCAVLRARASRSKCGTGWASLITRPASRRRRKKGGYSGPCQSSSKSIVIVLGSVPRLVLNVSPMSDERATTGRSNISTSRPQMRQVGLSSGDACTVCPPWLKRWGAD